MTEQDFSDIIKMANVSYSNGYNDAIEDVCKFLKDELSDYLYRHDYVDGSFEVETDWSFIDDIKKMKRE